jgi:hypothetical protein
MLVERGLNVWVPHQEGVILKTLMGNKQNPGNYLKKLLTIAKMPSTQLIVFGALKIMQGNVGLVTTVRSFGWLPIQQVL